MTKEDLQQIRALIREELAPIKDDISQIKEDIDTIKVDLEEVRGTSNLTSEWAEALTEYYFPHIHYPLESDEKIKYK